MREHDAIVQAIAGHQLGLDVALKDAERDIRRKVMYSADELLDSVTQLLHRIQKLQDDVCCCNLAHVRGYI